MEKLKEKTKQVKGITLIALVVTIIVLLILAGVSISMLTGDKGILGQANNAKKQTEISSEKEAIQLTMINKEVSNNSKYDIGRKLYKKTLENSNIWDVIVINETQEKYDDGWRYIPKETEVENYGKTKYNWLVNEDTGEFVQLEEGKYTELSYKDELAVTDGLVFNVDSNNMDNNDLTTWGEGVSLHGFEDNTEEITNKGLNFDGKNDYVEFKSTADYSKGFTLSFYGIANNNYSFFSKQREDDVFYSCRFAIGKDVFEFNTSKNRADSKWSIDDAEDNGNLRIPCSYSSGDVAYFDLIFDAEKNEFKLYENNKLIDSDIVNEGYWHGENGGKQIMEDKSISCNIARSFAGASPNAKYSYCKLTLYSLRLYNRPLNESELKSNYDKTIAHIL